MKQVIIIGAGPSGSTCGYLLKKAGVNCIIIDYATFPREKICGGGLTPKAHALLDELMPGLKYNYQGVNRFRLMQDGKTLCVVDLDKELRMVQRKEFDHILLHQYLAVGGQIRGVNRLFVEQYVEKGANEFIFDLSTHYKKGYYYSFPNIDWDIVGVGGDYASTHELHTLLNNAKNRKTIPIKDAVQKGAFIAVDTIDSGKKQVILIGDAGGFANKLTYEGLYYAFATGSDCG